MSSITPNKTVAGVLLAHTQQSTAVVTVGAAVDVSSKLAVAILVKLGRTVATALSNEIRFRLEGSFSASDNAEWVPIQEWTSATGKTACNASTVNDASFNAGDTTFTITSATGIAAGDYLYLRETGTPANSEWVRVASVSGTTITLEEATTRNHTNGIATTDFAESFSYSVNVEAFKRVRLVVDSASAASGQTVDVIGWINTLDSLTVA